MNARPGVPGLLAAMAVAMCLGWQPRALFADSASVPLPVIENGAVSPRLLYIENPRFPAVSIDEIWTVFRSAADLVRKHLGVTVNPPDAIQVLGIDDVFRDLVVKTPEDFGTLIGDFRNRDVDWSRVKEALVEQIEEQKDPLAKQVDFARPYLIQPLEDETLEGFAGAVAETFRARLMHWTVARLQDGHPVIGKAPGLADLPYNEYRYWALMAKLGIDAEIILTNQLVASVEYASTPVHTSIRGGITGGSTEFNPSSRLGTLVWVSLFPQLSDDERIVELRNGDTYSRSEALAYAGIMLAHEMGHQLFHLGHPWSNDACIMRPAEVLDFASWARKLDAGNCRLGSSPAMTPGAVRIPVW